MIYPIVNGFTKQLKTGGNQLVQHHKHRIMGSNQEVTGNSHANWRIANDFGDFDQP